MTLEYLGLITLGFLGGLIFTVLFEFWMLKSVVHKFSIEPTNRKGVK